MAPERGTRLGPKGYSMADRRRHPRVGINNKVWLNQDGPFVRSHETFGDLSGHGAFLRMNDTYAIGRVLDLRFMLSSADTFITCSAIVRHQRLGQGIRVEFFGLSPETLDRSVALSERRFGDALLPWHSRRQQ